MNNIKLLIPQIIMFIGFFTRGIILITTQPTFKEIEIQNKYRRKKGEPPMIEEDIQKLRKKRRIIGVMLLIIAIAQLVLGIIIVINK